MLKYLISNPDYRRHSTYKIRTVWRYCELRSYQGAGIKQITVSEFQHSPYHPTRYISSRYFRQQSIQRDILNSFTHDISSRGFAFIGFVNPSDGDAAIQSLNLTELNGRQMTVQKAKRERGYDKTPGTCEFFIQDFVLSWMIQY